MAIRLLLVTDGDIFNFGAIPPAQGLTKEPFTLNTLVGALRASTNPVIQVDLAHRRADANALFQNFNFANVNLSLYDEIWMIADEGSNGGFITGTPLTDAENLAITGFMQGGGGVLAVGDHSGLGSFMCGALPRVRSMRLWWDIANPRSGFPNNWPGAGPTRVDTLRPAPDGKFYFDSQSDAAPQQLTLVCKPLTGSMSARLGCRLQAVVHARDSEKWSIEEASAPLAGRMAGGGPAVAGERAKRVGIRA